MVSEAAATRKRNQLDTRKNYLSSTREEKDYHKKTPTILVGIGGERLGRLTSCN